MSEWTGVITEVVDEVTLLKLEVARQKDIKRIVNDTLVSVAIYADKLKTENTRLKELNREMVEVFEMMVKIFKPKYDMQAITSVETITIANAEHVLAKAGEGEGE